MNKKVVNASLLLEIKAAGLEKAYQKALKKAGDADNPDVVFQVATFILSKHNSKAHKSKKWKEASKAIAEGLGNYMAEKTADSLQKKLAAMKAAGVAPADFEVPSVDDLKIASVNAAERMVETQIRPVKPLALTSKKDIEEANKLRPIRRLPKKDAPWLSPNSKGQLPGAECCQKSESGKCVDHDPLTYRNRRVL